jgi:hypothetical protein
MQATQVMLSIDADHGSRPRTISFNDPNRDCLVDDMSVCHEFVGLYDNTASDPDAAGTTQSLDCED